MKNISNVDIGNGWTARGDNIKSGNLCANTLQKALKSLQI